MAGGRRRLCFLFVALARVGEEPPGPLGAGRATPWKVRGSGRPLPGDGLPNARGLLPMAQIRAGAWPGKNVGKPPWIGSPKGGLRIGAWGCEQMQNKAEKWAELWLPFSFEMGPHASRGAQPVMLRVLIDDGTTSFICSAAALLLWTWRRWMCEESSRFSFIYLPWRMCFTLPSKNKTHASAQLPHYKTSYQWGSPCLKICS